jgi:hypothetical protein
MQTTYQGPPFLFSIIVMFANMFEGKNKFKFHGLHYVFAKKKNVKLNIFITPSKLCEHFVLNRFMFCKGLVGFKKT